MMGWRDRFDRSKRKSSTRTQRIGLALFWLLVLAYAYIIPVNQPNFNSESHLYVAFSIVDHHAINIDRYHMRLGDESQYRGHYYSDKAPGLSFLAVPIYAGLRFLFPHKKGTGYEAYSHMRYAIPRDTAYIRYAITYLLVIIPSALLAVLLWLFLTRLIASSARALLVTVVYALGTIAYVYSTQFYSHQISAILLFGAFLALYRGVRREQGSRSVLLHSVLAGVLAGYAIISEYPTALIVGLLALYLLAVGRRRLQSMASFGAGMVPPALLGIAYNILAFGKPLATGYAHVDSYMYKNEAHTGLFGLTSLNTYGIQPPSLSSLWQITFGAYRGIFLVSPVLILFFAGIYFMWRRRDLRPELWLCAAVVVLYFLMDASRGIDQNGWSGGWSVASRHLTPMLPFMMVPIAFGLGNRLYRLAFGVLGGVSMAFMFMIVTARGEFSFTDHNPLIHEMVPYFFHGKILVNWGYLLGQTGFASLVPFFVVAGALVARIMWLYRVKPEAAEAPARLVPELEAG